MIIDFAIQNFRSLKEQQIFSLFVEKPKQNLRQHVAHPAGDKIGALRAAGIYGANASGKSNVLLAFKALRSIACESGDLKEGMPIPWYEPYRLSEACKTAPVKFEIEFFTQDHVRCLYAISFNREAVLDETLDFFPSRQKANIFKRAQSDTWETIGFGGLYKGGTKRIPFFKNNSYLSKAGDNAGASDFIRSIYNALKSGLLHIGPEDVAGGAELFDQQALMEKTAKCLSFVDTGISHIEIGADGPAFVGQSLAGLDALPRALRELFEKGAKKEFLFSHQSEDGGFELFKLALESAGTQKLFGLLPVLIKTFSEGKVLIMDEIEGSLHPHIAEMIIDLFNDPGINANNAQLIFSTHNIGLMSPNKLRRDQIWFTEKNEGRTRLFSLDEFDKNKVKADSPFRTWYNEGRFGAVPALGHIVIANLLRPQHGAPQSVQMDGVADGDVNA